eukprot:scaffold15789_cov71-Cylindrotheca_fusiformis.AAC.1
MVDRHHDKTLIQPLQQQQSVEEEAEKQQKNDIAKVMMMRINATTSQFHHEPILKCQRLIVEDSQANTFFLHFRHPAHD